ncbi:MAG: chorion class high-cysteine HCB protein 13 [Ruminococcus sp.]|nr:chorion class high-cysteine HCB protein 13 [Ruminococcus sp.]
MSDLNCGCGCDSCDNRINTRERCECGCSNNWGMGNNSCLWIILLLFFCGGNGCGSSMWGRSNDDCGCGNNSCIWIILLLFFCGGCGNNCC